MTNTRWHRPATRRRAGDQSTLADNACNDIRALILTGAVPPGAPLRPAAFKQSLGVSPTVVREALTRLTREHIVVADAHRGFQVRQLLPEDLQDLARVRVEIESIAIRWSIDTGGLDWESEIVSALHRYVGTVRQSGRDANRAEALAHGTPVDRGGLARNLEERGPPLLRPAIPVSSASTPAPSMTEEGDRQARGWLGGCGRSG